MTGHDVRILNFLLLKKSKQILRMNFWKKRPFFVVFCPENVYLYAPKIIVSICMALIFSGKDCPTLVNYQEVNKK